ncbi:uncharacterized protein LAJ45_10685 [Morchella importuna]|uniref:uncharacterized protein n=1 Tax=Morchella importuna TaxID=1174673 RepID=UPI001E8E0B8D|nr:uncharacterized protein LAJ45_10685 [Morchella importuna]KAH8145248.1 hypothetical protein LAJ45_10685 [Morchella importuna]
MELVHRKDLQASIGPWLKLLELLRKNEKNSSPGVEAGTKSIVDALAKRGNKVFPATCPFVENGSKKGKLDMDKQVKIYVLEFEIEGPVLKKAQGRPRTGKAEIQTTEIKTVAKRGKKPAVNPALEPGGDVQEINYEE